MGWFTDLLTGGGGGGGSQSQSQSQSQSNQLAFNSYNTDTGTEGIFSSEKSLLVIGGVLLLLFAFFGTKAVMGGKK